MLKHIISIWKFMIRIMNLDANNLCGYAMSIKLPVDGFEWVEDLSTIDDIMMKIVM